jgi:hypothetical protein
LLYAVDRENGEREREVAGGKMREREGERR